MGDGGKLSCGSANITNRTIMTIYMESCSLESCLSSAQDETLLGVMEKAEK